MQVTKNIISSLYFPMIIRCGAKKYQQRICHTILNQRYFPILELLYRYRYDHIRNVAKRKKNSYQQHEWECCDSILRFKSRCKQTCGLHQKAELLRRENRNKMWVEVLWKVGSFYICIVYIHRWRSHQKIRLWGIILIYITQVNLSSGKYNCCDFILHSWYLWR